MNQTKKDAVNILIVDDRRENLQALEAVLSGEDRNLVMVSSGKEAIQKLLNDEYALILLDVMMPGMDGFELARLIKTREKTRNVPIIFLTAIATDVEHIFKGYSVGAVDYLAKPLEPEIVKAKVAVFIELYKKNKTIEQQSEQLHKLEIAELKRSEQERIQNLMESIPQMVWTCKADGKMDYFNKQWFSYTGLSLKDSLDEEGWLKPIQSEERDGFKTNWKEHLYTGNVFESECQLQRMQDQTYRWHLLRAIPIKDGADHITGWVGTYTDIEDQKNAQIELSKTLQTRDEFFSIASHELKTPINSLGLKMQILDRQVRKIQDDVVPKQMVLDAVTFSKSQMGRLVSLIDNLLDISRIRMNRLTVDPTQFDFVELVDEVVSRMEDQARQVESYITVNAEGPIVGQWDKLRLEQLMVNLISNAIKYGSGEPIKITATADKETVTLRVKDNGVGISRKDQARIFEQFERASPTGNIAGLGLGLYIVKKIIEAHKGTIRLESEVGRGSEFIVELPRENADIKTDAGKKRPPEPESTL